MKTDYGIPNLPISAYASLMAVWRVSLVTDYAWLQWVGMSAITDKRKEFVLC
jgi:hypothetical protein